MHTIETGKYRNTRFEEARKTIEQGYLPEENDLAYFASVLLQIISKQQFAFKKHDYMFKAINVIMENVPFSSDYSKALSVARMMYSYGWICGIRSKRTGVRIKAAVRAKAL